MQRSLVAVGWSMVAFTVVALIGLALDPREITGAPAWLKPLKFALSAGVYAVSLAWVLRFVQGREVLRLRVALVSAVVLVLEVALIALQAARGVTSHFNDASPLDGAIFSAMGLGITALWVCQLVVAAVLLRQPAGPDAALAWSLRLGMGITALGAGVGWIMVAHHGHTVGALDGGPGAPLTNWSLAHGDLRAAHALGLHALQVIPLLAWALGRVRALSAEQRARLTVTAGLGYGALVLLATAQALRAQPLTALDGPAQLALGIWAGCCALGAAVAVLGGRRPVALEAA
ncbi:MAG: hypothetical protein K1X89_09830 [Myxococcaceae bacterium]|nr:hypothetical protein [Myxococcaceae bacterium]